LTAALQIEAVDPVIETLEISAISRDVQVRVKTDRSTVEDYARAMLADPDARWPVVICFREKRTGAVFLSDGNHRLEARALNGETTIVAEVRDGGKREALAYAVGSSKGHGLRFSNADKRKAGGLALKDSKLKKLSDNQLAALIGVSQPFISKLRAELITVISAGAAEAPAAVAPEPEQPEPVDPLPRLLASFRRLLGQVPADSRAAFSEQVLELLSATGD
jgi:hypothetical protein